jgi:hypothetical protein
MPDGERLNFDGGRQQAAEVDQAREDKDPPQRARRAQRKRRERRKEK